MGGKKKVAKEKPLEKMTAKELRELAMQIPEISGVHGMNKIELISGIKKSRGIEDDSGIENSGRVREIKVKIKEMKVNREKAIEEKDERMAQIFRKKIIRLKKKTRKAA